MHKLSLKIFSIVNERNCGENGKNGLKFKLRLRCGLRFDQYKNKGNKI